MYDHLAIYVKDLEKSYGSNKILNNLCLNVKRGCIYGLLGSSGCGKTTLLSCIIGRLKPDNGEVYVLGGKQQEILATSVGFMPQTLSLVGELTVKDTIYFFGKIYNMTEESIKKRYNELVELLDLPTDNSYIKNCSGGQKRRVSFAASMVHRPELLILDEPTVGQDPILRDRVWNYLLKISQQDKTTVIITTHYIEETRQADQVGLMREGKLLIEENPGRLLSMYNKDSLEEVYLMLCIKQEQNLTEIDGQQNWASGNINLGYSNSDNSLHEVVHNQEQNITPIEVKQPTKKKKNPIFTCYRFKALMRKNFKMLSRNYGASLFPMGVTFVQVVFFLIGVGGDTTNNPFGIVNGEKSVEFCKSFSKNDSVILTDNWDCHIKSISCVFENYLDIPLLYKIRYNSSEKALEDLKRGKIRGFLNMHSNLSQLMEKRITEGLDFDNLPDEEIQVYMDMSSLQIGGAIKTKIYDTYEKFQVEIYEKCQYLSKSVKIPLRLEETFFGTLDDPYTIFITPGVVTTMIYFMGVILTCLIILDEKCEGIWDRTIIAGVTALELSISHLIYQVSFMVIMTVELVILIFFIFGQSYVGPLWLIFLIIYLQGLNGIVLGFGISIMSSDHIMANIIVSGLFTPLVITSGVMWPMESLNEYFQWVIKCLPLALPTNTLRNIIKKGAQDNLDLLQGFGILILWIIIFLTFSIYLLKRKR